MLGKSHQFSVKADFSLSLVHLSHATESKPFFCYNLPKFSILSSTQFLIYNALLALPITPPPPFLLRLNPKVACFVQSAGPPLPPENLASGCFQFAGP